MKNVDKNSVNQAYLDKSRLLLYNKYSKNLTNNYNTIKINEIISNAKSHLVTSFKDFLLFEEDSEFFKRYYNGNESFIRIKKLSNNLNKKYFIYPNYASIEERKYILSNIIRKQMLFNKLRRNKNKLNLGNEIRKRLFEKKSQNQIFSKDIYADILAQQKSESFIYELFGLDNKNKNQEQSEISEINDLNKIIKIIENNENLCTKMQDNKIKVNICKSNLNKTSYNYIKILNGQKNILRKNYNNKNKHSSIILESTNNEETEDNSNMNLNNQKNDYKKMIYHRKVKSSLMDSFIKFDLFTNSNKAFKQQKKVQNKKENNTIISNYKYTKEKNLNKLTRNNKNNNDNNNNKNNKNNESTFIIKHNNRSVYIKNKVLANNMSNKSIFSNINNKSIINIKGRQFNRPYSKPKCIFKNIKSSSISNKTYYYKQNEVIFIERIK